MEIVGLNDGNITRFITGHRLVLVPLWVTGSGDRFIDSVFFPLGFSLEERGFIGKKRSAHGASDPDDEMLGIQ